MMIRRILAAAMVLLVFVPYAASAQTAQSTDDLLAALLAEIAQLQSASSSPSGDLQTQIDQLQAQLSDVSDQLSQLQTDTFATSISTSSPSDVMASSTPSASTTSSQSNSAAPGPSGSGAAGASGSNTPGTYNSQGASNSSATHITTLPMPSGQRFVLVHPIGIGSVGTSVSVLQGILIATGFLHIENPTGYFGALTQKAVQVFQSENGIVATGTPRTTGFGQVGPKTATAISSFVSTAVSATTTSTRTAPSSDMNATSTSF
jgi:peptidoglycan hydrolase-like protein with peptidoglycan-binding domain